MCLYCVLRQSYDGENLLTGHSIRDPLLLDHERETPLIRDPK